MAYFSLLNLHREPFSNSPDPSLFFRSAQHAQCLQKLELAIRLRRGLNIVQGEIGAGKTTLCRHLIQSVAGEDCMDVHLLLDPAFSDELELLQALLQQMVGAPVASATPMSAAACKERIQQHLFQRGVEEDRIIVLIVDEAQKLTPVAVEVLRELLNYETNDHKLLQIVLFGQLELDAVLKRHPNFADRANLIHTLEPMDAADVGAYIRFRLEQSERPDRDRPRVVFTAGAIRRIAEVTGGYPRKINHLCHDLLLSLVVRGQHKVTRAMVDAASGRYRWSLDARPRVPMLMAGAFLLTVGVSAVTAWLVTTWKSTPAPSVVGPEPAVTLAPTNAISEQLGSAGVQGRDSSASDRSAMTSPVQTDQAVTEMQADLAASGWLANPATSARRSDQAASRGTTAVVTGNAVEDAVGNAVGNAVGSTGTLPEGWAASTEGQQASDGSTNGSFMESDPASLPETWLDQRAVPSATPAPSETVGDWLWPRGEQALLGTVTLQAADSVSEMASRIFGRSSHRLMQAILRSNPEIPDLNRIQLGDSIHFPLLRLVPAEGAGLFWLERGRFADLDAAYQMARTEGPDGLRVLAVLSSPSAPMDFRVVQRAPAESRLEAERRLSAIPRVRSGLYQMSELVPSDWLVVER